MIWLHLTSLILLTGTVFALRYLFMPSLRALTSAEATVFMGKVMNRARRVLRTALLILIASEVYFFVCRDTGESISWRLLVRLVLTLALMLIVLLVSVSPHRRLALRLERWRRQLLDATLALLIALTAVSHF